MEHQSAAGDNPVDQVVAKVKESIKYRYIFDPIIRRVAAQELQKRTNLREAVKSTRNRLHQIGGAYFDRVVNYDLCLGELKTAHAAGESQFLKACQRVMCYHSSTRERLAVLDRFYTTVLKELPPPHRILDLACGFNPLAIPWMHLPENIEYLAVDIYGDMIEFINQYLKFLRIQGMAYLGDVIAECPDTYVDIAFILKTIPCLEQVDKTAGERLLDCIQARHIIASFPIHSLGGRRDKGMLENYSQRFTDIIVKKNWSIKKYDFPSELVYIVSKSI